MTTANYEESPHKVGGEYFSVLEVASAILRRRRTVVAWTFVASLFALYVGRRHVRAAVLRAIVLCVAAGLASAIGVSAQIPTTLPTPEQARLLIEQDPERARM